MQTSDYAYVLEQAAREAREVVYTLVPEVHIGYEVCGSRGLNWDLPEVAWHGTAAVRGRAIAAAWAAEVLAAEAVKLRRVATCLPWEAFSIYPLRHECLPEALRGWAGAEDLVIRSTSAQRAASSVAGEAEEDHPWSSGAMGRARDAAAAGELLAWQVWRA